MIGPFADRGHPWKRLCGAPLAALHHVARSVGRAPCCICASGGAAGRPRLRVRLTWLFCVGWWPIVFCGARRALARRRHDSDGARFIDEREESVEYDKVRELRTASVLPWSTVADAFRVRFRCCSSKSALPTRRRGSVGAAGGGRAKDRVSRRLNVDGVRFRCVSVQRVHVIRCFRCVIIQLTPLRVVWAAVRRCRSFGAARASPAGRCTRSTSPAVWWRHDVSCTNLHAQRFEFVRIVCVLCCRRGCALTRALDKV